MAEVEPTALAPSRIGSEKGRQHPKEQEEWAPVCEEGNTKPCIPEGEYTAFCKEAKKYPNPRFKRDDIRLVFSVCEGRFAGTQLPRYYSAETAHKIRSHYFREWTTANNGTPPTRGQRMPLKKFRGKLFRIRVTTVKTDAYQEQLPPSLCYSKVAAILELLQTNEALN